MIKRYIYTIIAALAIGCGSGGNGPQPIGNTTPLTTNNGSVTSGSTTTVLSSSWQQFYTNESSISFAKWPQAMQMLPSNEVQTPPFPAGASGMYFNYAVSFQKGIDISNRKQLVVKLGATIPSGSSFQFFNDGCSATPKATMIPMIWGYNNGNIWDDGFRWWPLREPTTSVKMNNASSPVTLTIPLDPSQWVGVSGEKASNSIANWNSTLNKIYAFAVTFGGGCFYGHGVDVNGSGVGQVQIYDYQVTD